LKDLGLDKSIVRALGKLGISEFTEPQLRAIPLIMQGKNVLLVAPTGLGKTEAAILPLLHKLIMEKPKPISLLYITPLKSLNRDMLRRMTFFAEELHIRVAVRHGDTSPQERAALSRNPPDILITTPETFQILFTGTKLRQQLRQVRWVIVDEVHELADDERGGQLAIGLERLAALAGRHFQRIGLSATVGTPQEAARFLAGTKNGIEVVQVAVAKDLAINVEYPEVTPADRKLTDQIHVQPGMAAAMRRCMELVDRHRSTLFFVNTRDTAEFLSSRMRAAFPESSIGVHHGSLARDVRIQMEDEFKSEKLKTLICTSSLELGIDVGSADFTLQFNSPRQVTRLVQRVGRSGHGVGKTSKGTVIATSEDDIAEAMVIARKALSGELEPLRVRRNNMSVLANQLVSMTMTQPSMTLDEAFELVRGAYQYRDLKRVDFEALANQLAELRVLWCRDGRIGRSRGSMTYFYENISMIPDVRTYRVTDIPSRNEIGTLDEWFVAEYAKEGSTFVMKGSAWRFVEFKEDRILVEPVKDIGEVPSWIGEEIPVPLDVAMEVGRLRRERHLADYPVNEDAGRTLVKHLDEQGELPTPSDRLVTIESLKDTIVVNACFGTKVNETLAQLFTALLSARFGQSVGVRTDPYRIILQVPRAVQPDLIKTILMPDDPSAIEPLLRVALRNSPYLRWSFVHVAKKFGALRRDVDWEAVNIQRLLKVFDRTPLLDEVFAKVFWERLDIEATAVVLERIKKGDIRIEFSKLSPIGKAGLGPYMMLIAPAKADHATLMALKHRLEESFMVMVCLKCKSSRRTRVGGLKEKVRCPQCDGMMIAALRPYERELAERVRRREGKLSEGEYRKLRTIASLVAANGRKAVIALAARGVGPETAARILRGLHDTEEDFLRSVLAAEVNYARTKRFWD
jgi:ATP-dependent Lhr-like helicase